MDIALRGRSRRAPAEGTPQDTVQAALHSPFSLPSYPGRRRGRAGAAAAEHAPVEAAQPSAARQPSSRRALAALELRSDSAMLMGPAATPPKKPAAAPEAPQPAAAQPATPAPISSPLPAQPKGHGERGCSRPTLCWQLLLATQAGSQGCLRIASLAGTCCAPQPAWPCVSTMCMQAKGGWPASQQPLSCAAAQSSPALQPPRPSWPGRQLTSPARHQRPLPAPPRQERCRRLALLPQPGRSSCGA